MKSIFCGNFEYDARQSEIQRLFSKYGKVDRVDMKSGFAFIYMDDERDAEDAIRGLDDLEFGRQRRRLRVEWAKEADNSRRRREEIRRSTADQKPAKTLFVINFDPVNTRVRDLETHFEPYGKLVRVHIRKNFAFIEYETQEEATKALECTNMSKVLDNIISVEYAIRENGDPPIRRDRERSPGPREGYGRHGSPAYRRRGSPVYERYHSPHHTSRYRSRSPDYRPYKGSQ